MQHLTQYAEQPSTGSAAQPRTPAEVADWLTEKATDVKGIAMQRYPRDRVEQLRDEASQLRLLVETAAEHLHQFDRAITHLTTTAEVVDEVHAQAERNYMQRLGALAMQQEAVNA